MKQTQLLVQKEITHNSNISFPVGTFIAVKDYSKKLGFQTLFSKYKRRGIDLSNLVEALVSYRLSENQSLTRASQWINRPEVLCEFSLKTFEERTLFRVLETIGNNHEDVILQIQKALFSQYTFPDTDINMDWTSFVLWGTKAEIGKNGYSRDHRPDKKQITVGISQLRSPVGVPIGLTIEAGNVNDQTHFKKTFEQVAPVLKKSSLVVFDKGANSEDNLALISQRDMKYLSAKRLNASDDKVMKTFVPSAANCIDENNKMYGLMKEYPSRYDYLFFSENLKKEMLESKLRMAEHKLNEAKIIQKSIVEGNPLPKRFTISNPLIDIKYSCQSKLENMTDEEAKKLLEESVITGREGFFALVSSEKLTIKQALETYRSKDSIEKIFQSLKNDIDIRPLRVWTTKNLRGAVIIGFIAQLIISLMRYDNTELAQISPKFIKISLENLTVTIEKNKSGSTRRIFSNFDSINSIICCEKSEET
jgi:transposase